MNIELSNGLFHFYQWDTGQQVKAPDGVETIHFRIDNDHAAPITVVNGWATVPDECFQSGDDLVYYAYDENHTTDSARVEVVNRPKPDGYAYTPTEVKTWESLDGRITALEAANVQPNWDQNDDSAADYVRGRTHYVGAKHDVKIINQGSWEFTPELGLIVGNTYRVWYDTGAGFGGDTAAKEFVCQTLIAGDGGVPNPYAGKPYVGNADTDGGPNPYLIFDNYILLNTGFSHAANPIRWKIEGDFAAVKTLDLKYIDPKLLERIKALEDGGGVAGVSSINGQTGAVEITAKGLGALTEDDLQSATNAALAQAKASGEFDGAGLDVTGATVGQTVKISAVDANGVPTAWVPVDVDVGLSWIEVTDVTTSEQTKILTISTDKDGRPISQYNALGMIAVFCFPADTSQTSNNGAPWIYPISMQNVSTSYRYIANISGWKTVERTLTMAWAGLPRVGWIDQISSQTTFSTDAPDFLNGLTIYIPASGDHIPAGTRVRVAVLSNGVVE